jgi:hypothetical protein
VLDAPGTALRADAHLNETLPQCPRFGVLCPQLAEADIMAERVDSGIDPEPTV